MLVLGISGSLRSQSYNAAGGGLQAAAGREVVPGPAQVRAELGLASPRHNPMRGKPVAVGGASTGLFGAIWARAELRRVLGVIGAQVLAAPAVLSSAA